MLGFVKAFKGYAGALLLLCALLGGAEAAVAADQEIRLTWHGQGTTSIVTGGNTILIDAFFLQDLDIPFQVSLDDLPGEVRLILLTHGHADHFGAAAAFLREDLLAAEPGLLLAAHSELVRNMVAYGLAEPGQVIDWNKGGKLTPGGILQLGRLVPPLTAVFPDDLGVQEIVMVPAEHSSSLLLPADLPGREAVAGTFVEGGEAVGYVIRFDNGFTLYHGGDTYVFDAMKLLGERYDIDLALVPIGGNFTMDPADAAFAVTELLKPRFVIPVHYSQGAPRAFSPALTGTPAQFLAEIGPRQDIQVVVPERGQAVLLHGAGTSAAVGLLPGQ